MVDRDPAPDPEGDEERGSDSAIYGDYDWQKRDWVGEPWLLEKFGAELGPALAELRKLYPKDVCELLVRGGAGCVISGLFGWFRLDLIEMVALGADLALCPGWDKDNKLIAELRSRIGWHGARFEVGLWASLRRLGIQPAREPKEKRTTKAVDFAFDDAGKTVALEAKALRRSLRDEKYDLLQRQIVDALLFIGWLRGSEMDVSITVDTELAHGVNESAVDSKCFGHMLDDVHLRLQDWAATPPPHEAQSCIIPRVAVVERLPARTPGMMAFEFTNIGPGGFSHHVDRMLREVQGRAALQLASVVADTRVVAVWVPSDLVRVGAEHLLEKLRFDVQRREHAYRAIDWIVLSGGRSEVEGWRMRTVAIALRKAANDSPPRSAMKAVATWRWML